MVECITVIEDEPGVEDMIVETVVVVKGDTVPENVVVVVTKSEVELTMRVNSLTRGYEDCDCS
jgi:hypothetical protein